MAGIQEIRRRIDEYKKLMYQYLHTINSEQRNVNDCTRMFFEANDMYTIIIDMNQNLRKQIQSHIIMNNNTIAQIINNKNPETKIYNPGKCIEGNVDWNIVCKGLGKDWEPARRIDGTVRRTKGGCGGTMNCDSFYDEQYDGICPIENKDPFCKKHLCGQKSWLVVCNNTNRTQISILTNQNEELKKMLILINDPENPKIFCNLFNRTKIGSMLDIIKINQEFENTPTSENKYIRLR